MRVREQDLGWGGTSNLGDVHLNRLALTDFRSYAGVDLRLEPGVSTLIGANGEGKTNVVEAIGYLATLNSHRVASDAPLVRHGAERAILRGAVTSAERDSLVEIEINPGRANRARLNRTPVPRPRQVLGVLRTVLFAPEDLSLVKGDPEQRRRYLDDLLVAKAPRYAGVRADYERVLRQRTALLKSLRGRPWARAARPAAGPPPGSTDGEVAAEQASHGGPGGSAAATLDVWDEHLATAGAELLAARISLTAALRPLAAQSYAAVSGDSTGLSIGYRQSFSNNIHGQLGRGLTDSQPEPETDAEKLAAGLREALALARAEEIDRGVCLIGPHRDELDLRIGDLPARGYASHGESWSAALALRLAAFELLRQGGDDPVLLLDDVFAELDSGRRERLATLAAGAEQVIVTAAVAQDVPAVLAGIRFEVAGGKVTRAGGG
jgi:DNA replication and repair protein RecF